MEAALKKTKVKLYLLTDIAMLSIVEERIRGRICHSICQYTKANEKKKSSYLQCCDINICMVGQCCKSFDEDFIK